jgi:hypothetical protein
MNDSQQAWMMRNERSIVGCGPPTYRAEAHTHSQSSVTVHNASASSAGSANRRQKSSTTAGLSYARTVSSAAGGPAVSDQTGAP